MRIHLQYQAGDGGIPTVGVYNSSVVPRIGERVSISLSQERTSLSQPSIVVFTIISVYHLVDNVVMVEDWMLPHPKEKTQDHVFLYVEPYDDKARKYIDKLCENGEVVRETNKRAKSTWRN